MKVLVLSKRSIIILGLLFILIFIIAFHRFYFLNANKYLIFLNTFINNVQNLTNGKEKVAYLTFDDGPNLQITPKVLYILKSEDVKATFFVIGKYVEKYPEIVKRAYDEGHFIANHR